jgi:hypothetical protein
MNLCGIIAYCAFPTKLSQTYRRLHTALFSHCSSSGSRNSAQYICALLLLVPLLLLLLIPAILLLVLQFATATAGRKIVCFSSIWRVTVGGVSLFVETGLVVDLDLASV